MGCNHKIHPSLLQLKSEDKVMNKPLPQSVLSIDVGRKRIGLAGCDALGITVTKLSPLIRSTLEEDLIKIKSLCEIRSVKGLVVGLPLDKNGKPTTQAKHCERYGKQIAASLELPIAWVDEHSSTWAAAETLGIHGDRSGYLDSAAAAILLEQWLNEGPELEPI